MKPRYLEKPLAKTKIIATLGPACESRETLTRLIQSGVDLFRLNMAHGENEWRTNILKVIREVSEELSHPVGILGDLSGPKIRLGKLIGGEIQCNEGDHFQFHRGKKPTDNPHHLTCTYASLIDDLETEDRVLLADGQVEMRVTAKHPDIVHCDVTRAGIIRSRQGINLPGVRLSTPSLTVKDRSDLEWLLGHEVDYVGLSFVRGHEDVRGLRQLINEHDPRLAPRIIAKIEKIEAVNDLERIIEESDAVMVARGDLGVETDISRVPMLQKRIIRLCNEQRIPVITATQMLDSMQSNEFPTRAEASDVANAVLDGSDAIMLSGETAVGKFPEEAVSMMSRIAQEAERMVAATKSGDWENSPRTRATVITESVTLAATAAAEFLNADMIIVATHSGRTAMAVSRQRSSVPIVALTDMDETARRMTLFWGVKPIRTEIASLPAEDLIEQVTEWGLREEVLQSGSRLVLVGRSDWSRAGHDLMTVHVIP